MFKMYIFYFYFTPITNNRLNSVPPALLGHYTVFDCIIINTYIILFINMIIWIDIKRLLLTVLLSFNSYCIKGCLNYKSEYTFFKLKVLKYNIICAEGLSLYVYARPNSVVSMYIFKL